jgi:hypothetical protein
MSNNKKISQLGLAGGLTGSELVPVVKSGVTVQTTTQDIADLGTPPTPTLQETITEDPTVNGTVVYSPSGLTAYDINEVYHQFTTSDGVDTNITQFTPTGIITNGVAVATVNDIGTNYTQSFAHTGASYTLTAAPTFIYSIRTTTIILDETDTNDVTIVGTTLTVTNPNFLSGETLYIKYKA